MAANSRTLRFSFIGDTRDLQKAVRDTDQELGKVEKSTTRFSNAAKIGFAAAGAAAAGALVVGLKASAQAALESEKSNARLQAQLKALGISYKDHEQQITRVINAQSRLAGLDDEELGDSFTNIVRVTGDVNKALKLNALAADIARARNIDVARAGDMVAKAYNGNATAFKRLGVAVAPVTTAQDKLKESTKNATTEQIAAAKASDKTATAQQAIAAAQQKFAGQAEAYGKSNAGAADRASVAWENLQETLGAKLLPVLGKVANAASTLIDQFTTGEGPGGRVRHVFEGIAGAASRVTKAIAAVVAGFKENKTWAVAVVATLTGATTAFAAYRVAVLAVAAATGVASAATTAWNIVLRANPVGLVVTALVALGAGLVVVYKKSETFRNVVNGAFKGIRTVVVSLADAWLGMLTSVLGGIEKLVGVASHLPGVGGKFKGLERSIKDARQEIDGFRERLRGADDSAKRFDLKGVRNENRQTAQSFDRLKRDANASITDIRRTTERNTERIKQSLSSDTREGRDALAKNYNAAANAVKRQMDRAGKETREGVALMNHYLRAALAEYGITGKQATRYIAGNDTLTGKPLTGPGGKAAGGWIGSPGERGQDAVPIVVGRGEAVINRHQQAVIEGMLGDGFLDQLFSRVTTPHYMAKGGRAGRFQRGGIVSVPGFPGERAASSVIPMIEWVARTFGLTLTDAYGQGHKSPGHTRFGTAADFAGSNAAMDRAVRALVARGYLVGYDGRFGSQRWPGHGPSYVAGSNAHLHVELGGRGGAPAAAPQLGRVVFAPGMGVLSTLGQRGMDALRSGAQATLERAAGSIVDVGGGPVGHGGFSLARLAALWVQAGGPPSAARIMARVAMAESSGNPAAHNPSGATGLWQILGNPFPGNAFDPLTNARMAVAKYRAGGLHPWDASRGSWGRFLARGGFAGGGVTASVPTRGVLRDRGNARRLAQQMWQAAAPFYPAGARMPNTQFLSNLDSLFVGADDEGHVYWPDFMNEGVFSGNRRGVPAFIDTMLHEWAHVFQAPAHLTKEWQFEGGATAFAAMLAPRVAKAVGLGRFYRPYSANQDPTYGKFYDRVLRSKGRDWVLHGQFAPKARGGFVARAARGRGPRLPTRAPRGAPPPRAVGHGHEQGPAYTPISRIESAAALAALDPRVTQADITAARRRVTYYEGRLRLARRDGNPEWIAQAAQNLASARSSAADLEQQRTDAAQERAAQPTFGESIIGAAITGTQTDLALAGLTDDTGDDLNALRRLETLYGGQLSTARRRGNAQGIQDAAGSLKGTRDQIAALQESAKSATDALDSLTGAADTAANDGLKALADAMSAAVAEQKRTNDLTVRYGQIADPALLLSQFAQLMSQAQGGRLAATSAIPAAGRVAAL